METQTPNQPKSRPVKTLWAILAIIAVGVILVGIVVRYAFNTEIQDQLNSLVFRNHKAATSTAASTVSTAPEFSTTTPAK